jgi:hypothetical protein
MADELNVERYATLEIPDLESQVEEATKPKAQLPEGVYLAAITAANVHHGEIKPGNQWPSLGFMVEMSINPATMRETPESDMKWVSTDRMVANRQYVWLGYLTDQGISYRTKNNPGNTIMPFGAASFLQAVESGARFNGSEHAGKVVVVKVKHEAYTGNDGNEYIGLQTTISKHTENGKVVTLDLPKDNSTNTGSGSTDNPFE